MNTTRRIVSAVLALLMVSAFLLTSSGQPALIRTSSAQEAVNSDVDADAVIAFTLELFNEGNTDHVEEFVSPDLVIHFLDSRPDQAGVDSLLQWAMDVRAILPDVNVAVDQRIVEGNLIALHLTVTGTHTGDVPGIPPTGNEVVIEAMWMLRVTDGQIVEWWQLEDLLSTYTQLGLIPPMGSDSQE